MSSTKPLSQAVPILIAFLVLAQCGSCTRIKELLDTLNEIRTDPLRYRTYITSLYSTPTNVLSRVHGTWATQFSEALPGLFDEADNYLRAKTPTSSTLSIEMGLSYSAYLHSKFMAESRAVNTVGSGGSSADTRIRSFGTAGTTAEELISRSGVTAKKNGKVVILDFVIDDAVVNRVNRQKVFSSGVTKVGIGIFAGSDGNEYVTIQTSDSYTCTKCGEINCAKQIEMGWERYNQDAGIAVACNHADLKGGLIIILMGLFIALF